MGKPMVLRIATRGSRLALWQANHVRDLLRARAPGLAITLVEVVSTGDAVRDRPLAQLGGVGVFTKEVQEAVLAGKADLAVHSLKDLPTATHPELCLAAVPERGPSGDVLLAPAHKTLEQIPAGGQIATSSPRRRAQLLHVRPDLAIVDIRGNVETRVRKLTEPGLDGLVLARAGLERLGLERAITEEMSWEVLLPAVGQGALGIECRAADEVTRALLRGIEHAPSRAAIDAERAFLGILQAGCHAPAAAAAIVASGHLHLRGRVLDRDGRSRIEGAIEGDADTATHLGASLARELVDRGADAILRP